MAKLHSIKLNGAAFSARSGQLLLDAALVNSIDMPHDCRAGRCGTCVTMIRSGITLGGETLQHRMVHACQARVFSDLELDIEPLPDVCRIEAKLVRLVDVTDDTVELTIKPSRPLTIFPGQYCRFAFRGFPERPFSPTAAMDGNTSDDSFCLNIKRVRNGRVSTNLGGKIKVGHKVTIFGPYGHAFLRPYQRNRLVLVAGGTGFAPMWAIGEAALRENPNRAVVFVAGARQMASLYMAPALALVSGFPGVTVVAVSEEKQNQFPHVVRGRPSDHVPELKADDIVYAAGAPMMVNAVAELARSAKATFYSDPFEPAGSQPEDWITKAVSWLGTG